VASLGAADHAAATHDPIAPLQASGAALALGAATASVDDAGAQDGPSLSPAFALGEAPAGSGAAPQHHMAIGDASAHAASDVGLSGQGPASVLTESTVAAGSVGAGYFSHGIDVGGLSAIQAAAQSGAGAPGLPTVGANAGAVAKILAEALHTGHDLGSLIQSLPGGDTAPVAQLTAHAPTSGGDLGAGFAHANLASWTGGGFDASHLAALTHHATVAAHG
jgi:hypothetical protein